MGNNFGKFEEFKDIVERRVSETIEANKRGVKDYFENHKDYNTEEIPRVKENCLKEHCKPICTHGLCTPHIPSIEGLISHFKIGRFIYEKGDHQLEVQSKYEQKCSEITDKIFNKIEVIEDGKDDNKTTFSLVKKGEKALDVGITYSIEKNMRFYPQKIFDYIYGERETSKKWAFTYDGKTYVDDFDWVVDFPFKPKKVKKVKKVKKQKSVKKSKKIVKSIKVKSRTKKLTRRTPKKSH